MIAPEDRKRANRRERRRRNRARHYLRQHGWPTTPENVRDRLVVMRVLAEDYAAKREAKGGQP
jgi:hypothetical protein